MAIIWIELGLAVLALILFILRVRSRRVLKEELERDRCGLWRYHKETQFRRVACVGKLLAEQEKRFESGQREAKERRCFCRRLVRSVFGKKEVAECAPEQEKGKVKDDHNRFVAVISFQGDLRAKEHSSFALLVDEVEVNKHQIAEVVVFINSPGGMVSQYGHAFSEMERIRNLGVPLTVCVDVVAASGGYLMALPANKIIAAPFSMIGSIGVMAFVPNVRRLLLNWDINPRTFTAGRFKRTVSLTDEATPEEVALFQSQLEAVHRLFAESVAKYRKQAKIDEVTTGEHWTAKESIDKELGLVDELKTGRQYLLERNRELDLVFFSSKRGWFAEGVHLFASILGDELGGRIRNAFSHVGGEV